MNPTDNMSKSANETADKMTNAMHDTIDKVSNTANKVADNLGEKGEQMKDEGEKLYRQCRGFVNENPVTSLLIAAGVGYLFSKISD
jgi:ElaB/YqjD/DUF883 family membrane-anchored ribosome-binding protein